MSVSDGRVPSGTTVLSNHRKLLQLEYWLLSLQEYSYSPKVQCLIPPFTPQQTIWLQLLTDVVLLNEYRCLVQCPALSVSENCTICEIFRISAHCLTCLQGLCSECDRLYHSYPERANHRRTAVRLSSSSSSSSSQNRTSHRSGSHSLSVSIR